MEQDDALSKARAHLETAWTRFMDHRNLKAKLPDWSTITAGDGTRQLSVQVVGPGAAHALAKFITFGIIGLPKPGDTRPTVDFDTPGRTAYVWRSHGVWIELWVPDIAPNAPKSAPRIVPPVVDADPVRYPATPRPSLFGRASARLPYTRRRKETTTR